MPEVYLPADLCKEDWARMASVGFLPCGGLTTWAS